MNHKLTITTDNIDTLHVPAKVRPFLDRALRRGLTVQQITFAGRTEGRSNYIVSSTNPIDDWELWLYHTSGRNGGRLDLTRYAPRPAGYRGRARSDTTKLTRQMAGITIDDMADALDRHNTRQGATSAGQHTGERLAADTRQAMTVVRAVDAGNAAREAGVQAVKAPVTDPDTQALAVAAVATLKANARFALRVARNGRIWANTPGKVRTALINRGLVHASGGMLTDVGRVVRELITA